MVNAFLAVWPRVSRYLFWWPIIDGPLQKVMVGRFANVCNKKHFRSLLSLLLICGLLVVSIPTRAYAVGPVVLGPAIKYAIGAGIVSGGLYAANKEDLNYVINDYWTKASDHVKHQWQSAVIYGTGVGIILLNDPLKDSLRDYLDVHYGPGDNRIVYESEVVNDIEFGHYYPTDEFMMNDFIFRGVITVAADNQLRYRLYRDGVLVYDYVAQSNTWAPALYITDVTCSINQIAYGGAVNFGFVLHRGNGKEPLSTHWSIGNLNQYFEYAAITTAGILNHLYWELTGDDAGFGNATEGKDNVKIPCPPVPAAEWPDQWLDNLQDEMNRTGNPTLDDETSIEEWEDEYEWYLDQFGNIYKVKKGQPPRDPGDQKKMVPGPPLPAPDVPENYPTEDDPDLTVEHHPPQVERVENPDGSTTETTTQTTTTTRKWWDPSSQRWRTTTSDTTTTTTVDFAPDGTETGRTTTTTTQPKGEREETAQPDDTAIDWEPLRKGLGAITHKFPFSLPWDFYNSFKQFEGNEWDGVVKIRINTVLADFNFDIDLGMFDGIRNIVKKIELLIFDVGLIFATRRLMGGGV